MAIELTAKQVQAEKPSAVVKRIRDTKETGLCLVVAPSGTKSFSMQFTSPETGKRRYILIGTAKIGKSGNFCIKEAQEKAQELKKLIRAGVDPEEQGIRDTKAEVAAASEEADQAARDIVGSVDALFQLYLADLKIGELEMSGKKVVNVDKNKMISKDAVHLNDVFSMDMTGRETYLFPKIRNNPDGTEEPRSHHILQQTVVRYCTPKSGRAPCKRFSPRDLRRTMKTLSGKAGIDKELRDRLQGHTFQDVSSKNYDRYDYWPQKQQAMEQWCQYLETLVAGKNILPFRQDGAA